MVDLEACLQLSRGDEPRRPRASTPALAARPELAARVHGLELARVAGRAARSSRRSRRRSAVTRRPRSRRSARRVPGLAGLGVRTRTRSLEWLAGDAVRGGERPRRHAARARVVLLPGQSLPARAARAHGGRSSCRRATRGSSTSTPASASSRCRSRRATAARRCAVEQSRVAAEDARVSARRAGLAQRARARGGRGGGAARAAARGEGERIVLDPPRTGAGRGVVEAIAARRPAVVVYVSCDPPTLGRDLALFAAHGYRPDAVHLFDQFPKTFHLETVVRLCGRAVTSASARRPLAPASRYALVVTVSKRLHRRLRGLRWPGSVRPCAARCSDSPCASASAACSRTGRPPPLKRCGSPASAAAGARARARGRGLGARGAPGARGGGAGASVRRRPRSRGWRSSRGRCSRGWRGARSTTARSELTGTLRGDAEERDGRLVFVLEAEERRASAARLRAAAGRVRVEVGGEAERPRLLDARPGRGLDDAAAGERRGRRTRGLRLLQDGAPRRAAPRPGATRRAPVRRAPARGARATRSSARCRRDTERGLVRAMVLGDRSEIDDATAEAFKASGTYHVLALSGAQVALLAALLSSGCCGGCRPSPWIEAGVTTLAISGYAVLRGRRRADRARRAHGGGRAARAARSRSTRTPRNLLGLAALVLLVGPAVERRRRRLPALLRRDPRDPRARRPAHARACRGCRCASTSRSRRRWRRSARWRRCWRCTSTAWRRRRSC